MNPPVLTFEQQKELFRLIREYGDSCADVAVHPPAAPNRGRERAQKRHDKARAELGAFVESITEQPKRVTG